MQEQFTIIAKTFQGLEEILKEEIISLGGMHLEKVKRGYSFKGDAATLYRCNYQSRVALRFLVPLEEFTVRTPEELYKAAKFINWPFYFDVDTTFAIDSVVRSNVFTHSKYAALKVKDAIVDQFRDRFDKRPNINKYDPQVKIHLHIKGIKATILLDASGDSLHKRNYKVQSGQAPLNEVLAAGMLAMAEWKGDKPLYDPMCGSGTLLTEAAMIQSNMPAQYLRNHFSFMYWKDFDKALWEKVKGEADKQIKDIKDDPIIHGSDKSMKAVKISAENLYELGLDHLVSLETQKIQSLDEVRPAGLMITNPPYDERLRERDIFELYGDIGQCLKSYFTGSEAYVISSHIEALKKIGLKPSRKFPLFNGPLECRMFKFEMYEGSRRS